ncbi:MAG: LLM class F420-dependent oxidoreductase [Deltaproteobacteria bacterium]|nr:MAG: LLM class F420-dependent oxidoreductase [Deltaproteobacteria bacterium]
MKLGTQLAYSGDYRAAAAQAVEFERAGFDIVWVAEAYGFDAVSLMGYLAAKTERIEIGSGVLPVYTRTPTLLAQTAAGLDAVSDGRFVLGIGTSGPQVIEGWHGVPFDKPLARLRETIEICRKVWRRDGRLTHEGRAYRLPLPPDQGTGLGKALKIINHPLRPAIPIYVASLRPKSVEMTAEMADGWLPAFFMPEKAHKVWGEALAAGKAKRAPELGPLDIVAGGVIGFDERARNVLDTMGRWMSALYIGGMGAREKNFYHTVVTEYGFGDEARVIQDLYLSGKKDEAAARVPADLLERTNLVGDEGWVKERIAVYKEAGVRTLSLMPVGDVARIVDKVREWAA